MSEYIKPLPEPGPISKPFWDSLRQHKLTAQRCSVCSKLRHLPNYFCADCLSEEWTWDQLSGEGSIYTFTIMHRAPSPGFENELPLLVALVELKEGIRMLTNIVECRPEHVQIGMPVKVVYEDINDHVTLFKFAPA